MLTFKPFLTRPDAMRGLLGETHHATSFPQRSEEGKFKLTPGLAGASQHPYARAALLRFAISSRGDTRCCKRRCSLSEGDNDGEAPMATPKVHNKHLSKLETKVTTDREANASI